MALLINLDETDTLNRPPLYEQAGGVEGIIVDFKGIFIACAEDILCTKYTSKKVLNLDIVSRHKDYLIDDEHEVNVLYKLLEGEYESKKNRDELLQVMVSIWNSSSNFRETSEGIIKSLEIGAGRSMVEKFKQFEHFPNNLPISNLREYYRYRLYEIYLPIRNYLLNRYIAVSDSRVYKTDSKLEYLLNTFELPEITVMVGNNLHTAELLDGNGDPLPPVKTGEEGMEGKEIAYTL